MCYTFDEEELRPDLGSDNRANHLDNTPASSLLPNLLKPVISDTLLEFITPLPLCHQTLFPSCKTDGLDLFNLRTSLSIISDRKYNRSDGCTSLHLWGPVVVPTTIRCSNRFSKLLLFLRLSSSTAANKFPSFRCCPSTQTSDTAFNGAVSSFFFVFFVDFLHFLLLQLSKDLLLPAIATAAGNGDDGSTEICNPVPFSPADECLPETRLTAISLSSSAALTSSGDFSISFSPSTKKMSSGSTRYLQSGQVECASSQVSTHST